MWLIAEYEAVTLFSLKLSTATTSGGKTLLVPTPYAIKMALLDTACRWMGLDEARKRWGEICSLQVAFSPARSATVTNLFQKVLRPRRNAIPLDEPEAGFFQKTIGYREYVYLNGEMGIALGWEMNEQKPWLASLLAQLSYLGKRGGLVQLVKPPALTADLPNGYVMMTQDASTFTIGGTLQLLDDCAPDTGFEKVDIYSGKPIRLGKERILRSIVLPYRVEKSSRSFTHYVRTDAA